MNLRLLRLWFSLLTLVFTVGCFRAEADGAGGSSGRNTDVLVSAQYQKRILGPGGWAGTENRPARYCWAEVRQDSDDAVVASGYLDSQGQGTVSLPVGQRVYLMVSAAVEVPGSKGAPAGRGGVKLSKATGAYADEAAFKRIPDAFYLGQTATVGSGAGLSLTVPSSATEAGAFNIADQIATFHRGMDLVEPGLKVPSVHAFWSTDYGFTDFPMAALNGSRQVLLTDDPHRRSDEAADLRATFQFPVRRGLPGGPDSGADAFNDSVLQQSLCHLLFQDYSGSTTGATLLRRDNDDAYVSRNIASEPAVAFVNGFCDFLSCAFRGSNVLQDIDTDGTIRTFYMDRNGQFAMSPNRGEFYSGAIGVSLYRSWKNVLGGGNDGLFKLYDAAAFAKGAGEYTNTILAAYPSYLLGLRNTPSINWSGIQGELGLSNIGDITSAAYFQSGLLWTNQGVPFSVNGSVGIEGKDFIYDWGAQKTYRFVHSGTNTRRLTLTYPSGRDMIMELYDTQGLWVQSFTTGGTTYRQIDQNLTPGEYLVRVRAGYHNTGAGTWNFALSLQ